MKRVRLFAVAAVILLLCGCSDYNELNMQELVKSAGVDFEDGEVSVCIVCDGQEKNERMIKTASGESFFEAVRQMSGRTDKKLYWGHIETLVLGEGALSETLSETLDALLRAQDVYLDIVPIAVKGATAEEILSLKDTSALEAFANEENSRRFRSYPLWELLRAKEAFGVYIIPTVEKTEEEIIMSGGAVLSDKGLLGYLSGEELLFQSLLAHKGAGGYLPTIKAGEEALISFEVLANEIKTKKADSGFLISQKITLSPAEVKGSVDEEQMKVAAEKYLSRGYEKLISRAKQNGFGNIFMLFDAGEDFEIEVMVDVRISNVFGGK